MSQLIRQKLLFAFIISFVGFYYGVAFLVALNSCALAKNYYTAFTRDSNHNGIHYRFSTASFRKFNCGIISFQPNLRFRHCRSYELHIFHSILPLIVHWYARGWGWAIRPRFLKYFKNLFLLLFLSQFRNCLHYRWKIRYLFLYNATCYIEFSKKKRNNHKIVHTHTQTKDKKQKI